MDENTLHEMTEVIVDAVQPEQVILFGSRAKNAAHEGSDIDLLVVMPDTEESRRRQRRLTGHLYRCLARFVVPKDILVCTHSEVERWRNVPGHIIAESLREGKSLYAR